MNPSLTLYFAPGACSLAPHIVLREIDRPFEMERVDLKTKRTAGGADYFTINPKGSVPALQLNDEILTENGVVLQYLADLAPERQLAPPYGTFARYRLQEWLSFIANELDANYAPLFHPDTPPATAARARARLGEHFVYIDGLLLDRGTLTGETFTVADAYMFVMLRWCERFEIDRQLWPNIDLYYLRILDRPSVQAAMGAEGLLESNRLRKTG